MDLSNAERRLIAMTDTIYSLNQIKGILYPIFAMHNVRKAILFGSYGKGVASPKSDIDLFVDSGLRGFDFVGLLGDITDAIEKNVDLIDVTHVEDGSRIEQEIKASGVLIWDIIENELVPLKKQLEEVGNA
jgi:predicted nucleotidyltransferase